MPLLRRKLATEPVVVLSARRSPFGGLRIGSNAAVSADAREHAAFEALLEQCWEPLWRHAYRTTGNAEDAGDLLSETAIEGFKGFARFRGDTTFLRWMYRIMTTTRIDMLRRNARHTAESLVVVNAEGESQLREIADSSANPEMIVLAPMLSEPVQTALNLLSEEYRSVVVLADMEQLDYADVSQVLQIPVGTVRSRLHRARHILRTALSSYVENAW